MEPERWAVGIETTTGSLTLKASTKEEAQGLFQTLREGLDKSHEFIYLALLSGFQLCIQAETIRNFFMGEENPDEKTGG